MSLFQCDKCGCVENTACTNGYHCPVSWLEERPEVYASYREILGLKPDEPYGKYCSACSPIWFTKKGRYGVGPNPDPKPGRDGGLWHGRFERRFLPKGEFETAPNGNLRKKSNHDENIDKYVLKQIVTDKKSSQSD